MPLVFASGIALNNNICIVMMENAINEWVGKLKQSSLFHLSLGSKELFHSNFLYWLSVVDWEVFIAVMRNLADVQHFWWEDYDDYNDVEVRRESRNFDLSIYVRRKKTIEEQQEEADEKGRKDIWTPVFVLENKIKSLPRHEQLKDYAQKAFNDWKRGKDKNEIKEKWQDQPISYVLLSLYLPSAISSLCKSDLQYIYGSKNKKQTVELECSWIAKDYGKLYEILCQQNLQSNCLDKKILRDYCNFIQALHEIANNDWKIKLEDDFIKTIYPWAQKNYTGDDQTALRIDDIRQKVHYAQLQDMLEMKLIKLGVKAKHFSEDKTYPVTFATNYAHNIGILEVTIKIPKSIGCNIMLQLQGNAYGHAFCKEKGAAKCLLKIRNKLDWFMEFDEDKKETDKYPNSLRTIDLHPGGINTRARNKPLRNFKYYGDNFIYQNVLIPQDVSIEDVITAMAEDTKNCLLQLGMLKKDSPKKKRGL